MPFYLQAHPYILDPAEIHLRSSRPNQAHHPQTVSICISRNRVSCSTRGSTASLLLSAQMGIVQRADLSKDSSNERYHLRRWLEGYTRIMSSKDFSSPAAPRPNMGPYLCRGMRFIRPWPSPQYLWPGPSPVAQRLSWGASVVSMRLGSRDAACPPGPLRWTADEAVSASIGQKISTFPT